MTMETDQTHQNHVYNIPDDVQGFIKPQNSAETKHVAPRSSSKRMYIILGVAMAVIVVAMVAVVVPVVVIGKLNSDSKNADKAKCGPYSYPGIDIFSLRPKITTDKQYCPMKGDCWTGEQCYACFKRQEWKVGNINGMPVCCKNCEVTGLVISPSECRCLHNGHSSQNVQSRK